MRCCWDPGFGREGRPEASYECYIDGVDVPIGTFVWEEGHLVYTDGSALFFAIPAVKCSGAAAFEILGEGKECIERWICIPLPEGYLQDSDTAKHVAFEIAIRRISCMGTVAVNCQSIIDGFRLVPID